MKKQWIIVCLSGMLTASVQAQQSNYVSEVWVADQGNGTYKNPVLFADYSDPDVCRAGDDFYLTSSSFGCLPGLQILHSKDLVNWSIISAAVPTALPPVTTPERPEHGNRVWAPSIRHHNGEFYIFWGDPDQGIFMVKSAKAEGPWSEPVLVKEIKGIIDTCPLWDEDGKVYLAHAYAGSRAGLKSVISVCELNAGATKAIGPSRIIFDGHEAHQTCEGPKLYKKDGYYYIFLPAGGVATGWQVVLRSKNIYGPYESKIVMAQGKTNINGPHQGGWVDTNTGESWFVHFQDKGAYGRVIHLNPMMWVNDWSVIGVDKDKDGCGEPVTTYKKPNVGKTYPIATPPESDEFNTRHLGLQWQWHANKKDTYGFTTDLGFIRLYAGSLSKEFVNFWEVPNLLMQKFPAEEFTATTKLTFTAKQDGEQTGIIVMGWDYSYLSIRKAGDQFILQQAVCKDAEQQNPERIKELANIPVKYLKMPGVADNEWQTVYLQVKVRKGAVCTFAYSLDGKKYTTVGETFTARQGKWIGAKVGLFCVTPNEGNRGWADVDWFRMNK